MNDKAFNLEDKIIAEALGGSEAAFKNLYDSYKKSFFLICLRYASNKEEAEDMLQDSFITIFKELHQYDRTKGSFYSWGSRVVINTNLQSLRKKKLNIQSAEQCEEIIKITTNDQDVLSEMEMKQMILALQKMPVGYRTVFNLYHIEGYSHSEIAELLGITESTSRTQLMKSKTVAKNILIKKLEITR